MAIAQDFLLNGLGGDILIKNGDFMIGPSDLQAQHDIINSPPGYFKQYPSLGVGLILEQNGAINITQLSSLIVRQLKNDGFISSSPKITLVNGELTVQPNAFRN